MKYKNNLYKDILIFGIATLLIKSVNLFLVPIYTRFFSPIEYGLLEILSIVSFFLSEIIVMGSDSAQSFYFSKYKKLKFFFKKKLITSILHFRVFWGLIVICFAMLFLLIINIFIKLELFLYLLSFINIFIFQILIVGLQIFRNNYQPLKYILISATQVILTSLFTIILVIFFNFKIEGALYSLFFSNLFSCLICWFLNRKYIQFVSINFDWWPKIIRFGLPLLPVGLSLYLITFLDRWLVKYYFGYFSLGIYAVATKIAFIILLFTESFRIAWNPYAMDGMAQNNKKLFKDVARIYLGLGMIFVVILVSLGPLLIKILTTEYYYSAHLFIGFVAISNIFFSFTQIVCVGILKKEKTIKLSYSYLLSLLFLVCIQYIFIKFFGLVGIPMGVSISYIFLILIIIFFSEKLWRVNFSLKILLLQIFFGFGFVLLFSFANFRFSLLESIFLTTATVFMLLIITINKEDSVKLKFIFNKLKLNKLIKYFF
jgi:O-antigen/teichoic acid export membrane protein